MKVRLKQLLELALLDYSNQEPDITLMCNNEESISTSKFLLLFHSKTMRNIFIDIETDKSVSLVLPFSSGSVTNLLNILATGQAVSDNTDELIEVNSVAKALGIKFKEWELGSQSNSSKNTTNTKTKKINRNIKDVNLRSIIKNGHMKNEKKVSDADNIMEVKPNTDLISFKRKQDNDPLTLDKNEVENISPINIETKRLKMTVEKRHCLEICNICGKSFTASTYLKKHQGQKVCERKIAHKKKLEQLMRAALESVNGMNSGETKDGDHNSR